MAKAKGRKKAGRSTGKRAILERLRAEEAGEVLRRLLEAHPELGAEAEEIALSRLREIDCEGVAEEVEDAVRAPGYDELNGRAGPHEWGYVDPADAAWEILEEAVEPFIADMKCRIELGLEPEALEICKGVILGLYRVEQGKGGEVAEFSADFPAEAAGDALDTWRKGNGREEAAASRARRSRPAFPRGWAERFVPEWAEMIARTLSGKG
jgi:hypothetical protein